MSAWRAALLWLALALPMRHAFAQRAPDSTRALQVVLAGVVRDDRGQPVANARVSVLGTSRVAYSDEAGRFRFAGIPAGTYALRVARLGRQPVVIDSAVASVNGSVSTYVLPATAVALSLLTITPGSYTLLDQSAASRFTLSRDALRTAPQLAEDVFRSLNRLPGLSGSDYSAKLRVRNGGVEEQLVTLDGLELIEPFHLKDFDGALSILDGESIGRVTVTTGGFTAASGNRLTGLLDMESSTPLVDRAQTAVGLSVSNVRGRSEGRFAGGRGSWLVSGRRGYLDLLFKLLRTNDPPDLGYYDLFGKVQYSLGANHLATVHVLVANDQLQLTADDSSTVTSAYTNRYVWSTVRSRVGERVTATTLAAVSSLSWRRDVRDVQRLRSKPYDRVRIADTRSLQALSIKQDWVADVVSSMSVLFGAELRSEEADFAYRRSQIERAVSGSTVVVLDSTHIDAALAPSGARTSGYVSVKVRPWSSLTAEVGGRADRHGWTRQTTVSPRTNVAWIPRPGTTLRAAWGQYHQAQALADLSVIDGDTTFARAERAEQRVVAVEMELARGWTARVEGFQRLLTSPRARYVNVDGGFDSPIPESDLDRVRFAPRRARVQGAEWLAQYDRGGRWRGGAAFVYTNTRAEFAGYQTVRPFDEPLAATLDASFRHESGWTWSMAWTSHSGWPTMRPTFAVDTVAAGRYVAQRVASPPRFNERLATYARLDLRATRTWPTAHGGVRVWADLFNALNRKNQRGYDYRWSLASPSSVSVQRTRTEFLGRLPTVGVGWEF